MKWTLITQMTALCQLKIWAGKYVGNMTTIHKCGCSFVALRIKKASGIFRELITTTRRSQSGILGPVFWVQKRLLARNKRKSYCCGFSSRVPSSEQCAVWSHQTLSSVAAAAEAHLSVCPPVPAAVFLCSRLVSVCLVASLPYHLLPSAADRE